MREKQEVGDKRRLTWRQGTISDTRYSTQGCQHLKVGEKKMKKCSQIMEDIENKVKYSPTSVTCEDSPQVGGREEAQHWWTERWQSRQLWGPRYNQHW